MGVKLINEVLDCAPAELTPAELVVLLVIAEDARDNTREAWPGLEKLTRRARLSPTGLRTVFQRLAGRGLEVRVAVGTDRSGRAIYAREGHQTTYRVPDFSPSGDASTSPRGDASASPLRARGDATASQRRRAESAEATPARRPSPHIPSLSPHNPREASPVDNPPPPTHREDPETLPDSLRTIRLSLLHTNPDSTLDEAHAVHSLVIAKHHPKSITYYRKIAGADGFGGYLAEVRAAAAEHRRRDLEEQLRTAPPCEHGQPGGQSIRTPDGQPSCALCRRGMPADQATAGTDPARADMVSAYREVAIAAGRNPDAHELITITQLAGLALRLGEPTGEAA